MLRRRDLLPIDYFFRLFDIACFLRGPPKLWDDTKSHEQRSLKQTLT
jgi:hypothetical protein